MGHRKQGTGSWAGNRDRHQKRQGNGARTRPNWSDQGKRTNSDRNRGQGFVGDFLDSLLGIKKSR